MPTNTSFIPTSYEALPKSDEEKALMQRWFVQKEDARNYFLNQIRPRLDRSYKLYSGYTGDRAREIQEWMSNVWSPVTMATVETVKPRILDARPDLMVLARNEESREKVPQVNARLQYDWEHCKADDELEDLVSSSLIYGMGHGQVSWKRDIRKMMFLDPKKVKVKHEKNQPITIKDFTEKEQVFHDGPSWKWIDNYDLWYDWHNIAGNSKQYWLKRRVLSEEEITRDYPNADPLRVKLACKRRGGDVTNFASIRMEVKQSHRSISRMAGRFTMGYAGDRGIYAATNDQDYLFHEVFEWHRPFGDTFAVMVGDVPILHDGYLPNMYDFKEAPFFSVPFLRMAGEFEGVGLPLLMESPQLMLNTIKNQRIDAATLNIHKTWIINPLANVNKKDLVIKPYGIIYSSDPNSVREVQVSDVKQSAYEEERLLKQDLQHVSGIDDASMGVGSGANATEIRHLRESTLERVRLFINHLGSGLNFVLRTWLSMHRQFPSGTVKVRTVGADGSEMFVEVKADDLKGEFDFKSRVIPSIEGMNDVEKKMAMDLYQLLAQAEGVSQRKLVGKTVSYFGMGLNDIMEDQQEDQPVQPGMEGMQPQGDQADLQASMAEGVQQPQGIDEATLQALLSGAGHIPQSQYAEASSPIDVLSGGMPPTAADNTKPAKGNSRGLNRGTGSKNSSGRVNTTIPSGAGNPQADLARAAVNTQR